MFVVVMRGVWGQRNTQRGAGYRSEEMGLKRCEVG